MRRRSAAVVVASIFSLVGLAWPSPSSAMHSPPIFPMAISFVEVDPGVAQTTRTLVVVRIEDQDGSPDEIVVEWGDSIDFEHIEHGLSPRLLYDREWAFQHTYISPGAYLVRVTVRTSCCIAYPTETASASVSIEVPST